MITNLIQRCGLICLLFFTIACNVNRSSPAKSEPPMKDTLVFTGCQEKITLKSGVIMDIKLEAIQGTGYQWIVKESSPLLVQLQPDELKYSSPDKKEEMVGMAGYQILQFKAVSKGEGEIKLEYKRTFETQVEKSCVMRFTIE
jgi:predicted secreted protein